MKFYTIKHKSYGGIDLHVRKIYLCVLDAAGEIRLHLNINTDSEVFLNAIEPFREDVVVAVECMFTWKPSSISKNISPYIKEHPSGYAGLVQPQDKIVDRSALTIYPYSFSIML